MSGLDWRYCEDALVRTETELEQLELRGRHRRESSLANPLSRSLASLQVDRLARACWTMSVRTALAHCARPRAARAPARRPLSHRLASTSAPPPPPAPTAAEQHAARQLDWPTYLSLRKSQRVYGLVASIPTTLIGFSAGAGYFVSPAALLLRQSASADDCINWNPNLTHFGVSRAGNDRI